MFSSSHSLSLSAQAAASVSSVLEFQVSKFLIGTYRKGSYYYIDRNLFLFFIFFLLFSSVETDRYLASRPVR